MHRGATAGTFTDAWLHTGDAAKMDDGLRPLMAHCHLGLGVLSRRAGTRQQAREHLTTAGTMFGEMDMRYWREQAGMKELA